MSAESVALATGPVDEAVADETVRRTVHALIRGRGKKVVEVAEDLGWTTSTLYRKLGGWGSQATFTGGEIAILAAYFGQPIERLFDGLGGTFVPPTNPDGTLCARRDSNPQPSDP